jgi:uncharacterized membrane protein SpoIIM required for sporulation
LREGLFIRKNKERWEKIQEGTVTDADELAKNFTQLVDDLAYAKTFYPSSRVTHYVNTLASRIFMGIYKNRKDQSNRLLKFWKYDVPNAMYRHRLTMLFSFFVFILFFIVGFFSAEQDPQFTREILGNGYVEETEKNIRNNNPFGIYGNDPSFYMFMRIMLNNLIVTFTYFVRGLLLGIPTMYALVQNSIMVGVFEQMFFAKGLGGQAVVTILIHGMLELTGLVIACGAGFVMGKSMLFPGTVKRFEAFREGAKDGVKLVVGLVPIFVTAALLESYVTRYYKMPLVFSLAILATCFLFVLWYFVLYPAQLNRKQKEEVPAHV